MRKTENVFFDTNVYINLLRFPEYEAKIERFLQGGYLYVISKIVLMELWAGAKSKVEETILTQHEESIPSIGSSDSNFVNTGKILRKMTVEYDLEPKMRRRLTWDILVALSAKENSALLVTENQADFKKIQRFVDFDFISP